MSDINEFFAFLSGLVVGLVIAILALVIVTGKMENRMERGCLLDQTIELNGIEFACEMKR